MRRAAAGFLSCLLVATCVADAPGVTAVDLLATEVLPGASLGMTVEDVLDGERVTVRTLGADFVIDRSADPIECRQRIAAQRPVAVIRLPPGTLADLRVTSRTPGAPVFSGKSTLRINGDSLLMLRSGADGPFVAELAFTPDYFSQPQGNYNVFDPHGGISFFEHGRRPDSRHSVAAEPVGVTWDWRAGEVIWEWVSPPKHYDWKKSIESRVVVYGSSLQRYMYPDDLAIHRWRQFDFGDVLMFHGENGWENWQTNLIPRDLAGHQRIIATAREKGLKFCFHTSPKAVLKGTVIEDLATPDVNDAKASGWNTGSNVKELLRQAERLVNEYGVEGLYFGAMYSNPRALATRYWLTRVSRRPVGDGPLCFHSTTDVLGDGHTGLVSAPINAYFDLIYKGVVEWPRFEPGCTRYILATYNTSNSIGVQVYDERFKPTPEQIDFWLRSARARFFLLEYMHHSGEFDFMRQHYQPRLGPALRGEIEPDMLNPTGVFYAFRQSIGEMG